MECEVATAFEWLRVVRENMMMTTKKLEYRSLLDVPSWEILCWKRVDGETYRVLRLVTVEIWGYPELGRERR